MGISGKSTLEDRINEIVFLIYLRVLKQNVIFVDLAERENYVHVSI